MQLQAFLNLAVFVNLLLDSASGFRNEIDQMFSYEMRCIAINARVI